MNTEITDNGVTTPAGWIFFDAECRFCAANRRRWGRVFERRGFVWLPLQTPGAAERLGVTPERLMAEMWVLPAEGPPVSGVEAWTHLLWHVWWLRPLAAAVGWRGVRGVANSAYRWMARHRHCIAGSCRIPPARRRRESRHIPFLELP